MNDNKLLDKDREYILSKISDILELQEELREQLKKMPAKLDDFEEMQKLIVSSNSDCCQLGDCCYELYLTFVQIYWQYPPKIKYDKEKSPYGKCEID